MIGQIIGTYKIESKLGDGGMGTVYKGVDTMLDREVAIKALKPELASQTAVVERFRTEAITLAKLNHPNIATLYSLFRQDEELYMVLEFVRGETLDHILERRGALPAEEAIPVFCQVLDGIDHAHEFGIVHRDIKPANMMLTEKGTLKVLDFGIARLLGRTRLTKAGNIIGTLEYMAPEQVRGLETDGRSDLYAMGMMLYEILTGEVPFDSDNEFELMKSQIETTPPSPRSVNPNIPEAVSAAIMKAIEKDPIKRFQTGREFREALFKAGYTEAGTIHGLTGSHGLGSANHAADYETRQRPALQPSVATLPKKKELSRTQYVGVGAAILLLVGAIFAVPFFLMKGTSPNDAVSNTQSPDPGISQPLPAANVESVVATDPAVVSGANTVSPANESKANRPVRRVPATNANTQKDTTVVATTTVPSAPAPVPSPSPTPKKKESRWKKALKIFTGH
jgi:serine/threonine-protein kinase